MPPDLQLIPIPVPAPHRERRPPPSDPTRRPAPASASSSRPGEARECPSHGPVGSASGPPPSTPTWPSRPSDDLIDQRCPGRHHAPPRRPELRDQGPRARACSRSCPRWASRRWRPTPGRRSSRPSGWRDEVVDTLLPRAPPQPDRRHQHPRDRATRSWPCHATAWPVRRSRAGPPATSPPAASTSGGAKVSTHLFNPDHRLQRLQHATRTRRYDIFKDLHPRSSTTRPPTWPPCGAFCGSGESTNRRRDRVRSGRDAHRRGRSRSRRSSSGSTPGPCRTGPSPAEAHETLAIAMNRLGGSEQHR